MASSSLSSRLSCRASLVSVTFLSALWATPALAQAPERIVSYDVGVEVHPDGSMRVVEDIVVHATGESVQRGIFRDFPTHFPGELAGTLVVAPFEVLSVQRDGTAEPYELMSVRGPEGRMGVRVRIGQADRLLAVPADYLYRITYRTDRWTVFGEGSDQLYWNVTGNGWQLPIDQASARVRLPRNPGADDVRLEAWTGPEGSQESNATAAWDEGSGTWAFRTTMPLEPGHGLTVRLTFPDGIVQEPDRARRLQWLLLDLRPWLATGSVLLVVLLYYLVMWHRVGRDPPGRRLMVEYRPPEGLSPAAVRFLMKMGFDRKCFTAAVVSLASKGRVLIEEKEGVYTLKLADDPGDETPLAPEEEKVLTELFSGKAKRLKLESANHGKISGALKGLRTGLAKAFEVEYFRANRNWFLGGLALTALAGAWLAWTVRFTVPGEVWFLSIWLAGWSVGVAFLVVMVFAAWRGAVRPGKGGGQRVATTGGALFITLFALPFFGGEIAVSAILLKLAPAYLLVGAVALAALTVLFHHLLKAPTVRGRMAMDQIEGYRTFLSATEKDRIDFLHPPERTPELFESYLPYAIALDVESQWAEQFEGVLLPGAEAEGSGWSPTWYHGTGTASSIGDFASSFGGSFSSALSSASSAPSSGGSGGGGGGGGGSSGGGGGGGGGGGW